MTKNSNANQDSVTVEVLYQKMGNRWYAFSILGDDVFFAPVPEDALNADGNPKREPSEIGSGSRVGNT